MKTSAWATFTFKDIVWVVIIVLIVLFLSKCHRDKSDSLEGQVKAVNTKHQEDSIKHAVEVSELSSQILEAEGNARKAEIAQGVSQNALDQSVATSQRLAKGVRASKTFSNEAAFVTVNSEFVDYCDSLALVTDRVAVEYSAYKFDAEELNLRKDTLIKLTNKALTQEKIYATECRKDYNALLQLYKEADKQVKPKTQVYVGAELIGGQQALVNAAGIALSLKTKTNKLWQVSGGLQNKGGFYARINGNILIRLRKN